MIRNKRLVLYRAICSCSIYIRDVLGAARWNTAASFPKWHFAKTNFLASAISDHTACSRNTAGDRDCGAGRCFDVTKDSRNFGEIQSTTVRRLQKPSTSKPPRDQLLHTLCRFIRFKENFWFRNYVSNNSLFAKISSLQSYCDLVYNNGDLKTQITHIDYHKDRFLKIILSET